MAEGQVLAVIFAVGTASYAMRAGGFLAASVLPRSSGGLPRLLRLAPGNLAVAFAAAGIAEGGWPSLAGCLGAVIAMAVAGREWAGLGAGFGAAALAALLR